MSEREQFEAWVRSKDPVAPLHRRDVKGSERIGQYCVHWIQDQWESWQASRRAALEEAATLIGTKGKRPCDCDACDCGNSGDMRAVAWWDEAKSNAERIRALAASDSDGGKS
jgi:hypothetical protein